MKRDRTIADQQNLITRRSFIRTASVGATAAAFILKDPANGFSSPPLVESARVTTRGNMEITAEEFERGRKYADTPFGKIAYFEKGNGPVALFIHGWPLNGFQWRGPIARLSDVRRCIALDTMGLGHTQIKPDQNLAFTEQAKMAEALLDSLKIDRFDLVGNDSGGGISQLLAVRKPERVRSLTLTNCEVHDNGPSPNLAPIQDAARQGVLRLRFKEFVENPEQARVAFGSVYEHAAKLSDETFRTYLQPFLASPEKSANMERFILSLDHGPMVAIEEKLKKFMAPTLIVWGTADTFFPLKWAHWLKKTIPGARDVVEVPGAKLFFPEEYPELLSERLRSHWEKGVASGR